MSRSSVFRSFAGRFTSGFLVFALALALVPLISGQAAIAEAAPAGMQKGVPAITLSSGSNTTTISFAGQDWWAIGYDGQGIYSTADDGKVTLFLKTPGNPYGNTAFDGSGQSYDYSGSALQEAMNTIYRSFPTKEQNLVSTRDLDGIAGKAVTDQSLWPISTDEWTNYDSTVRSYSHAYWLRSPSVSAGQGWVVQTNGTVRSYCPVDNDSTGCSRPAFSLNLDAVFFASASDGSGKDALGVSSTLTETEAPTGPFKFTVEDASLGLDRATATSSTGRTVTFSYSGATPGTTLSAVIERTTGATASITHYGKLVASVGTDGEGSATLTLPDSFDFDADTIQVFTEELNGNNYTDFASAPVELELKRAVPTGLTATAATHAAAADGSIASTTTDMEYKLSSESSWTSASDGSVTGLTPGSYEVRYASLGILAASDPAIVAVDFRPSVTDVAPAGSDVATTTTKLSVAFDKGMDTATGTVNMNGRPLILDGWDAEKKIATYALPTLIPKTTYTVNITGFLDSGGNAMNAYADYAFITADEPESTGKAAPPTATTIPRTGDNAPFAVFGFIAFFAIGLAVFARRKAQ